MSLDSNSPTEFHYSDHSAEAALEGGFYDLFGYQLTKAQITTNALYEKFVGIPFEMKSVEFTILHLVNQNPGITPSRLSKVIVVSASRLTVFLDRLEARKFLQRQRSSTDGRGQSLQLTAAGKKLVTAALKQLRLAEHNLFNQFSNGEKQLLIELLHKVAKLHHKV